MLIPYRIQVDRLDLIQIRVKCSSEIQVFELFLESGEESCWVVATPVEEIGDSDIPMYSIVYQKRTDKPETHSKLITFNLTNGIDYQTLNLICRYISSSIEHPHSGNHCEPRNTVQEIDEWLDCLNIEDVTISNLALRTQIPHWARSIYQQHFGEEKEQWHYWGEIQPEIKTEILRKWSLLPGPDKLHLAYLAGNKTLIPIRAYYVARKGGVKITNLLTLAFDSWLDLLNLTEIFFGIREIDALVCGFWPGPDCLYCIIQEE